MATVCLRAIASCGRHWHMRSGGTGIALSPFLRGRLEGSKSVSQVVRFVAPLIGTGESADSVSIFPGLCLMVMGLASWRRIHSRGMASEKKTHAGALLDRACCYALVLMPLGGCSISMNDGRARLFVCAMTA